MKGNRVFIGSEFWYFGNKALELPMGEDWAQKMVNKHTARPQNILYIYRDDRNDNWRWTIDDLNKFQNWLPRDKSIIGEPCHREGWESESDCKSTCGN